MSQSMDSFLNCARHSGPSAGLIKAGCQGLDQRSEDQIRDLGFEFSTLKVVLIIRDQISADRLSSWMTVGTLTKILGPLMSGFCQNCLPKGMHGISECLAQ